MLAGSDAATGRARANSAPRPGTTFPAGARGASDAYTPAGASGAPAGDMDQAMAMYLLSMGSGMHAQPQHAWPNGMPPPQTQHHQQPQSQQQPYGDHGLLGAQAAAPAPRPAYQSTPMDTQESQASTEAQPDRSPGAQAAYQPQSLYMSKDASPGSSSTGDALGNFTAIHTALQMQDGRTGSPYPNALPGGPAAAAWLQAMMYQQYQQAGRNGSSSMASDPSTPGFTPGWGGEMSSSFSATPTENPLGNSLTGMGADPSTLSQQRLAHLLQMGGIPQQGAPHTPFGMSPSPSDLAAGRAVRNRTGRSHTISHGSGSTHQAAGGVFATAVKNRLNRQRAGTDAQEVPPSLLTSFGAPESVAAGMAGAQVPFNKKVMSETSLAHKLRITSASGTSSGEKDSKPTEWGVLEPETFDSIQSALAQVHQISAEREARWAANPLPAPGSKVDQLLDDDAAKSTSRSRKRSMDLDDMDPDGIRSKEPHNAIERRYRNNINDRIAVLRNAVPALRDFRPTEEDEGGRKKRSSRSKKKPAQVVDGISLATKLNKATILAKSTEYIYYLKGREAHLMTEIEGFKELLRSFVGGEELLEAWLKEMECIKRERKAEKAAITPQTTKNGSSFSTSTGGDGHQDLDPLRENMDEDTMTSDVSSPRSGSTGSPNPTVTAGVYMMAAFLGVTWVDNQTSSPAQGVSLAPSVFQSVISSVRFWLGVACVAVLLAPLWMRFVSRSQKPKQSQVTVERRARSQLLAQLSTARAAPADTDTAFRVYLSAPRSGWVAMGSIAYELLLLALPDRWLTSVFPALATAPYRESGSDDDDDYDDDDIDGANDLTKVNVPSHAWFRLLELETALGPFAQPNLALRAHTLLSTMRRARLHRLAHTNTGNLRIDATAALALGRMGKTQHTFGRLLRRIASVQWAKARSQVLHDTSSASHGASTVSPDWLEPVLSCSLDEALAMLPPRTTLAAAAASSTAGASAYLCTPLLVLSSRMHMAALTHGWQRLFTALVYATAPRTLSWRTEWAGSALQDPDAASDADDGWDSEGSVSLMAFLAEYGALTRASAACGADSEETGAFAHALRLCDDAPLTAELDDLVAATNETTAPGTPAHLAARLTRIAWTFISDQDKAPAAQAEMLELVSRLAGQPAFGPSAAAAVVACIRLVLGDAAGDEAGTVLLAQPAAEANDTGADTFALIHAGLAWLTFLRGLAAALAGADGRPDVVLVPRASHHPLLQPALDLRRVLARTTCATATVHEHAQAASSAGARAEASAAGAAAFAPARDTSIDILTHLCYLWSSSSSPSPSSPPTHSFSPTPSSTSSRAAHHDFAHDESSTCPSDAEFDAIAITDVHRKPEWSDLDASLPLLPPLSLPPSDLTTTATLPLSTPTAATTTTLHPFA